MLRELGASGFGIILAPKTQDEGLMSSVKIILRLRCNRMNDKIILKARLASLSCCTFQYIFVYCRSPGSASKVSAESFPSRFGTYHLLLIGMGCYDRQPEQEDAMEPAPHGCLEPRG